MHKIARASNSHRVLNGKSGKEIFNILQGGNIINICILIMVTIDQLKYKSDQGVGITGPFDFNNRTRTCFYNLDCCVQLTNTVVCATDVVKIQPSDPRSVYGTF